MATIVLTAYNMQVKGSPLYKYSAAATASTIIHTSHCSTNFLANIHKAMMLNALINPSMTGTLLSVYFIKSAVMAIHDNNDIAIRMSHSLCGVRVIGISLTWLSETDISLLLSAPCLLFCIFPFTVLCF